MTKRQRKLYSVIAICLLIVMVSITLTGCSRNPSGENKPVRGYTHAMLLMPDGTIIEGRCNGYHAIGYTACAVKIDGVEYKTSLNNVVLWKDPFYNSHNEESE